MLELMAVGSASTFGPMSSRTGLQCRCESVGLLLRLAVFVLTAHLSYDCNGTPAQIWTVTADPGPTKLQLAGTNFCLDAGSSAHILTRFYVQVLIFSIQLREMALV